MSILITTDSNNDGAILILFAGKTGEFSALFDNQLVLSKKDKSFPVDQEHECTAEFIQAKNIQPLDL